MSGAEDGSGGRVRIDKWLWAARFFKTRTLAAQAVEGGKIQVNGQRVKAARDLKPGDALAIRIGELEWLIEVRALATRRGPAEVARGLYEESEASRARRLATVEARRRAPDPASGMRGRPTKRDRRLIRRFTDED